MATVSPLDVLSTLQPPQAILGAFGGDPATLHPRARRAVVAVERLAVLTIRAVDDAVRVGGGGRVNRLRQALCAPRAGAAVALAGWPCQARCSPLDSDSNAIPIHDGVMRSPCVAAPAKKARREAKERRQAAREVGRQRGRKWGGEGTPWIV